METPPAIGQEILSAQEHKETMKKPENINAPKCEASQSNDSSEKAETDSTGKPCQEDKVWEFLLAYS